MTIKFCLSGPVSDSIKFEFNVCHLEVFNTYINIQ